jgi:hypothetical protein
LTGVVLATRRAAAGGPAPSPEELKKMAASPEVLVASFPWVIALVTATLAGAALLGGALSREPWRDRLALRAPEAFGRAQWAAVLAGTLAVGNLLSVAVVLAGLERASPSLRFIGEAMRAAPPQTFWPLVALASLGPGLAEELFFRGYVQTRLVARHGRWLGVALASVCFGVMHFDPIHTPLAVVVGAFLGWAASRARSVWPGVVAHAVNNAASSVAARFVHDAGAARPTPGEVAANLALAVGSAAALAWSVRTLRAGGRGVVVRPALPPASGVLAR